MKKFRVQTLYSGEAIELTVYATKASDAKKHIQVFFKDCRVLKVREIKNDDSSAKKQTQRLAA